MVVIIENLSGITAGSLMVGTPIISVRRPINPGLIKDLWIMPLCPKTDVTNYASSVAQRQVCMHVHTYIQYTHAQQCHHADS